jgi:hypothetical protein
MELAIEEAGAGISPDRVVISSGRNGLSPLSTWCQAVGWQARHETFGSGSALHRGRRPHQGLAQDAGTH